MGYITEAEFKAATTGAQTTGLAAGALQTYIDDASAQVDAFCNRSFVAVTNVVEYLYSDIGWSAIIGPRGFVTLKPIQSFPITNVDSVTWQLKGRELTTSAVSPSVSTLAASDYTILKDPHGYGNVIRVFLNFLRYRSNGSVLFTVQYDAGFATYPAILKRATILWVTGLLKRRGDQAMMNTPEGFVAVDASVGEVRAAMNTLQPLRRLI